MTKVYPSLKLHFGPFRTIWLGRFGFYDFLEFSRKCLCFDLKITKMAQASLNQAVPDEETKMLIEIMQLLKDKVSILVAMEQKHCKFEENWSTRPM